MNKLFLIFISSFFFFLSVNSFSQNNNDYSVYLIGDAGEDTLPGKALLMLHEQLMSHPNSAVVFLGDNVYPNGLYPLNRNSVARLHSQLTMLKNYQGTVFFIPGNHDWNAQRFKGLEILKNEEVYLNNYFKNNATVANKNQPAFLPADGLPGPASVLVNNKLRFIFIDTQWFLHRHKKNKIVSNNHTEKLFYAQLDSLLAVSKRNNEQVIITAHHPLYANGNHAKSKQPMRFLINHTPLFFIGQLGLYRLYSQDLAQPRYKRMKKNMLNIINRYQHVIYVSGHEHNLQFFNVNENKFIVSGSGSKLSTLKTAKKFQPVFEDDSKTGFVKLIFDEQGNHSTIIFRSDEKEVILNDF